MDIKDEGKGKFHCDYCCDMNYHCGGECEPDCKCSDQDLIAKYGVENPFKEAKQRLVL